MKAKYLLMSILAVICFGCSDNYIDDLFVEPDAKFEIKEGINPDHFEAFESVVFKNTGAGQKFVVYTGDNGHIFGESGATGYATASNGIFTYSYQEPGEYNVVWISSSVKNDGTIVNKNVSKIVKVVSTNGGLDDFSISNFYTMPDYGNIPYVSSGVFVAKNKIVCPIMYASWRKFSLLSKTKKLTTNFRLSSALAKMYWINPEDNSENEIVSGSTATRIVGFTDADGKLQTQKFKVITASGIATNYDISTVVIPNFTAFSVTIDGKKYNATITRNLAHYDKFDVSLTLPAGSDLSKLQPEFVICDNTATITDGNNFKVTIGDVAQSSGISVIDMTSKKVIYDIDMQLLGAGDALLSAKSQMVVTIK